MRAFGYGDNVKLLFRASGFPADVCLDNVTVLCKEAPSIHAGEEWLNDSMGMRGRQVAGDEPACLVRQHSLASPFLFCFSSLAGSRFWKERLNPLPFRAPLAR